MTGEDNNMCGEGRVLKVGRKWRKWTLQVGQKYFRENESKKSLIFEKYWYFFQDDRS